MEVSLKIQTGKDKVDMLYYSWKLGSSEEQGKIVAYSDYYQIIVECVASLTKSRNEQTNDRMNELIATTFINSNLEKAQKIIDGFKSTKK